jgi:hypothetical protein
MKKFGTWVELGLKVSSCNPIKNVCVSIIKHFLILYTIGFWTMPCTNTMKEKKSKSMLCSSSEHQRRNQQKDKEQIEMITSEDYVPPELHKQYLWCK